MNKKTEDPEMTITCPTCKTVNPLRKDHIGADVDGDTAIVKLFRKCVECEGDIYFKIQE